MDSIQNFQSMLTEHIISLHTKIIKYVNDWILDGRPQTPRRLSFLTRSDAGKVFSVSQISYLMKPNNLINRRIGLDFAFKVHILIFFDFCEIERSSWTNSYLRRNCKEEIGNWRKGASGILSGSFKRYRRILNVVTASSQVSAR